MISTVSGKGSPCVSALSDSMRRRNAASAAPLFPESPEAALYRLASPAFAASCRVSSERAPIPRAGKLATRRKAPSSSALAASRIYAVRYAVREERVLDDARLRIRAVQHPDIGETQPAALQRLHLLDEPARLV